MSKLKKINQIFKICLNLLYFFILPLIKMFPRSKDVVVFGEWYGKKFDDNSSILFSYFTDNTDFTCIWITANKELLKELRCKYSHVYLKNSARGIYYRIKAKYYFVSNSILDVGYYLSHGATKIQLWHGLPIKKIERDDSIRAEYYKYLSVKSLLFRLYKPDFYIKYDYFVTSSSFYKQIFSRAFAIDESNFWLVGSPRLDDFLSRIEHVDYKRTNRFNKILYAPTFRQSDLDGKYLKSIISNKINDFLAKENKTLIIKLHPNDLKKIEGIRTFSNIIIDVSKPLKDIFFEVDILITDYSSVFTDFVLFSKPIIFYVPDLEEYKSKDRDFYFEFSDNLLPGDIIYNEADLITNLEKQFKSNEEAYFDFKVNRFRTLCYENFSNDSCFKIHTKLKELTN